MQNLARHYLDQSRIFLKENPGPANVFHLLLSFPRWKRAQTPGYSMLEAAKPWLPYSCIAFLKRTVKPGWKIFEFGAGGSTVFFSRMKAQGVTIEHDAAWAEKVRKKLHSENWQVRLAQPEAAKRPADPADPSQYGSAFPGCENKDFEKYVRAIDEFPDSHFDLVLIDGRSRPACIARALAKIKRGGFLALDDSQRLWYQKAAALPAGWKRRVFRGPKPGAPDFSETTVWQKI